jgi:HEAT repeat protein
MFPNQLRELTMDAALRDMEHPDPRVRATAADALGSAPAERVREACAVLRNGLDDGRADVRYAVALSLGELRDREAVDRLIHMLKDRDIMPRQAAAIALGRIGDKAGVEPLIQALESGSADVRFQATSSLVELDGVRAVAPLLGALEDRDPEVRGSAAAGLGDLEAHEAADALALLLGDNVESVRVEAAYALGRIRDPRGLPPLTKLTTHRDFGYMVCELLGRLGDREAVLALDQAWKKLFLHPQTRVRAAASLIRLGETAPRAYLLRACRSWRADVRGLALELLGEVGGEWALEALMQGLRGKSADAAVRGLGQLGDPSAISVLRQGLPKAQDLGDEDLAADIETAIARLEKVK